MFLPFLLLCVPGNEIPFVFEVEERRNPKAALPDPYTTSYLKEGFSAIEFSFPNLKTRPGIPYEILFAGKSSTEAASKALPALNKISAFPTTIFIDKKGKVRKVHTGFNGPATSKFHEEFKTGFNGLIDPLLAE